MPKVEAPNKDYNGPGPGGAVFKDGVAEVDDKAALNYYRQAGYKVGGKTAHSVETTEQPDPREVTTEVVGTRLRDAAVDPRPEDFLAPVNAGDGNPHGPEVVSPEIHASGPSGIRPGEVFVEDIDKQEKREKAYADARLIQQTPVAEAVADEVPDLDERGDLGISDPGSAATGKADAAEVADQEASAEPAPTKKAATKKTTAKKAATKKS